MKYHTESYPAQRKYKVTDREHTVQRILLNKLESIVLQFVYNWLHLSSGLSFTQHLFQNQGARYIFSTAFFGQSAHTPEGRVVKYSICHFLLAWNTSQQSIYPAEEFNLGKQGKSTGSPLLGMRLGHLLSPTFQCIGLQRGSSMKSTFSSQPEGLRFECPRTSHNHISHPLHLSCLLPIVH